MLGLDTIVSRNGGAHTSIHTQKSITLNTATHLLEAPRVPEFKLATPTVQNHSLLTLPT